MKDLLPSVPEVVREAIGEFMKALLEALAIVAYRQPILRADLESIRGVACGFDAEVGFEGAVVAVVSAVMSASLKSRGRRPMPSRVSIRNWCASICQRRTVGASEENRPRQNCSSG